MEEKPEYKVEPMEDGLNEKEEALFNEIISLTTGLNCVEIQLCKALARILLHLETGKVSRNYMIYVNAGRMLAKELGIISRDAFKESQADLATLMAEVQGGR